MSAPAYSWLNQPEVHALRDKGEAAHFGAWATIMVARFAIARRVDQDIYTPEEFDRSNAVIDARLDDHGEPPLAFVRCWILDMVDTYQWLADHEEAAARRLYCAELVTALRGMWKRYALPVAA